MTLSSAQPSAPIATWPANGPW